MTPPPGRLTDDDLAMLGWLSRVGYATGLQLARRFNRPLTSVYRRLGLLVRGRLVATRRPYRTAGVYLPTSRGLALCPLPLGKATVRTVTFTHDLTVVDLFIALEHAGHQALTEREMRYHTRVHATQPGPADLEPIGYRVELPGRGSWHYPDLVVESDDGRRWAVEVELTAKAPQRLRAIMGAWAAAPETQYAGVIYYASARTLRGIRAAVTAAYAEDFVRIRPLTTSSPSSPGRTSNLLHLRPPAVP